MEKERLNKIINFNKKEARSLKKGETGNTVYHKEKRTYRKSRIFFYFSAFLLENNGNKQKQISFERITFHCLILDRRVISFIRSIFDREFFSYVYFQFYPN